MTRGITREVTWVDPGYRDVFPPAAVFAHAAEIKGEIYRTGHGRVTMRFERGRRAFFLKRHSGVGWREIFKELCQGRLPVLGAVNEWRALNHLRAINIPSLRPVAYGRQGRNPARMQSFLITQELPGTINLEQLAATWRERPDFVALKRKLIRQTAHVAAAMHDAGVNHRDLYICHLEIKRDYLERPVGAPELFVFDLHRAQIRKQVPRRWRVKDVAALLFSAMDAGLTKRDYLRFIKHYTHTPLRRALAVEPDFWRDVRRRAERVYAAHPKPVSIDCVIPTHNYGRYIAQSVDSALRVLRPGDRVIVVDDGSTDDTRQQLRPLIDAGKIDYHYQANAGVSAARNRGTRLARGDYLYFLDADDRALKDGFEKLRRAVERDHALALAFGGHTSVHKHKKRVHRQKPLRGGNARDFADYIARRRFTTVTASVAIVRRDIALKYPYPEDLKLSEDIAVYAWIIANERVAAIPDPVAEMLRHDDSARNQTQDYATLSGRLPGIVFDPDKLPPALLKWKKRYTCNLLLELFRAQYRAGDHAAARHTYKRALRCRFLSILQWSYLRKYLRVWRA